MNIVKREYFGSEKFLKVYYELIRSAHMKEKIPCGKIAKIVGLPPRGNYMSKKVGQILGEISEWEHKQKRPMLSAVAIVKDKGMPGDGFFYLANELKKFKGTDKIKFWQKELDQVYNAWQ